MRTLFSCVGVLIRENASGCAPNSGGSTSQASRLGMLYKHACLPLNAVSANPYVPRGVCAVQSLTSCFVRVSCLILRMVSAPQHAHCSQQHCRHSLCCCWGSSAWKQRTWWVGLLEGGDHCVALSLQQPLCICLGHLSGSALRSFRSQYAQAPLLCQTVHASMSSIHLPSLHRSARDWACMCCEHACCAASSEVKPLLRC
jgi:hypothetical protein